MSTTHPQVGAYLDDLARMLADIDPGERDDILASVREHLDAEIGSGDGGDAVVHAALLRLGPPEQVAAEARSGQPGNVHHRGIPGPYGGPRTRHPRRTRVAAAVCLATVGLPALAALATWLLVALPRDGAVGWPESSPLLPHPLEIMILMVWLSPVWLVLLVVLLVGHEVSTRTKWFLAMLGPTTLIVILGTTIMLPMVAASTTIDQDPRSVSSLVSIAGLVGVLIWNIVTGRRVWRETAALS